MNWLIYIIAGLTSVSLVIGLVLQFCYSSDLASRWQLTAANVTVLMLCFAIISKGTP